MTRPCLGCPGLPRQRLSQSQFRFGAKKEALLVEKNYSSGAAYESRWPPWGPNEPSGFRGRKAVLNHDSALVSACP